MTEQLNGQAVSGTPLLKVTDLHAGYDKKEVVHGVDFELQRGEFVCIIGANGCGKTTLLKNILGILKPFQGSVFVDGMDAGKMDEKEHARHFAYIPQIHTPPFPFSVADVVIMGRTPYIGSLSIVSAEDRRIAYDALCQLSIEDMAYETYTQLSGGQQQLVLIARALAQQTDLLIMDEPTASLDFGNQHLVLSRVRKLTEKGSSVLMVTHDPNHAFFIADRVIVMEEGRIVADGVPPEVVTSDTLKRIYNSDVHISQVTDSTGEERYVCVPI